MPTSTRIHTRSRSSSISGVDTMSNQDRQLGQRFLQKTFDYGADGLLAEGHGQEGDPSNPLKFKLYQDTPHYSLPHQLQLTLGDARWAFAAFRCSHDNSPQ